MNALWVFAKGIFTEDTAGTTACPVRVSGVAAIVVFLVATIWMMLHKGVFDPQTYGIGFASMIVALGTAIGAKARLGADVGDDPVPVIPKKKGKS